MLGSTELISVDIKEEIRGALKALENDFRSVKELEVITAKSEFHHIILIG